MAKKGISLLLALSVCLMACGSMLTPGLAANGGSIVPLRYTHTDAITVNLNIAKGIATCGAYVEGKVGTTKITATVTLYRIDADGNLISEKTWDNLSADGDTLRFSEIRAVYSKYTYRLHIDATVYRNGGSENVWNEVDYYSP